VFVLVLIVPRCAFTLLAAGVLVLNIRQILFAPLTGLEVVGQPRVEGRSIVVEIRLNTNLHDLTIEQVRCLCVCVCTLACCVCVPAYLLVSVPVCLCLCVCVCGLPTLLGV
jgi:hypothetical protein